MLAHEVFQLGGDLDLGHFGRDDRENVRERVVGDLLRGAHLVHFFFILDAAHLFDHAARGDEVHAERVLQLFMLGISDARLLKGDGLHTLAGADVTHVGRHFRTAGGGDDLKASGRELLCRLDIAEVGDDVRAFLRYEDVAVGEAEAADVILVEDIGDDDRVRKRCDLCTKFFCTGHNLFSPLN